MFNISKHIKLPLSTVLLQPVRRKQIFTRQPRPTHFWAQKIKKVVKPVYPKPFDVDFPQHLKCRKVFERLHLQKQEENPYERILANEIKDEIFRSKMIFILHRNPVTGHYFHKSRVTFKKVGMTLFRNSRQTISMAVEDTKFTQIMKLFHSHTLLLCCPETNVHLVYSLLKTMPYYILLAGIVEDKFVSRHTLDEYSKLSDLTAARAQIAHTLNTPATYLAHNINLYSKLLELSSKE